MIHLAYIFETPQEYPERLPRQLPGNMGARKYSELEMTPTTWAFKLHKGHISLNGGRCRSHTGN